MDTSTTSYSESSFASSCGDEIQLSITRNYAQHWDTWEGVREMVQNWHDGLFNGSENITKEELKFIKVTHLHGFHLRIPYKNKPRLLSSWAYKITHHKDKSIKI